MKHVNKAQALTELQRHLDAVNIVAISTPPKGGRTIKTFAAEWEKHVGTTLKPSTLRAFQSHLRTYIIPRIGELPLTACTVKNVQSFISSLAASGLSRKSIENIVGTLQSMLGTAKKWSYVPAVFERKNLYLPRETERKEARFFDATQIRQIIAEAKEPFATMYAVLACTGIRAGEGLALKVGDLDFDRHIIRIRRTLDEHSRETYAPKSKASSADLPMPEQLEVRLREYLAKTWRENPEGWLFCNKLNKPFMRNKVVYQLRKTLKKLGIERAGLHAFRHAVASVLLDSGAPPSVVQRQMRHSDARITLQKYAHIVGDAQRRAVESLARGVFGN